MEHRHGVVVIAAVHRGDLDVAEDIREERQAVVALLPQLALLQASEDVAGPAERPVRVQVLPRLVGDGGVALVHARALEVPAKPLEAGVRLLRRDNGAVPPGEYVREARKLVTLQGTAAHAYYLAEPGVHEHPVCSPLLTACRTYRPHIIKLLAINYKDEKEIEIGKLKEELDEFKTMVEKSKNSYEEILDKTTKSIEKFIENAENNREKNIQ